MARNPESPHTRSYIDANGKYCKRCDTYKPWKDENGRNNWRYSNRKDGKRVPWWICSNCWHDVCKLKTRQKTNRVEIPIAHDNSGDIKRLPPGEYARRQRQRRAGDTRADISESLE